MNEELNVMEEITENVETATEEAVTGEKKYTEEEFNQRLDEILSRKIARNEAKVRKEYEKKYGNLEAVLRAGTGEENVEEITSSFRKFYEGKGIEMPTEPRYSDGDIRILARAEADDIINAGFDEVVEEVDRLSGIGVQNMSPREKALFENLARHRQTMERANELARIGVTQDVYDSKEFKDFAGKFNADTSIREIYDLYNKMQPKKEKRTMGSMKSTAAEDKGVKDFYSYEEASKFTRDELRKNPELMKAIEKSMPKW